MSKEGFDVLVRSRRGRVGVGDDIPLTTRPPVGVDLRHLPPAPTSRGPDVVPLVIIGCVVFGALIDDSRRRR